MHSALKQSVVGLNKHTSKCVVMLQETLLRSSYHISLSRVVPIRYHEIEPLLLSIKEALIPTKRCV